MDDHQIRPDFCPDCFLKREVRFNGTRHYHLDLRAAMNDMPFDGIAKQKAVYLENGVSPSNAAYGYVLKTG